MAVPDWTTVPDTNLEPGKPIRSIDIIAIKDSAEAIAGGATGAPRITGYAAKYIQDYDTLTVGAADTYDVTHLANTVTGILSTSSLSTVFAYTFTSVNVDGSIRFKASHINSGSAEAYLFLVKNDVVVGTWTNSTFTYIERSADLSVAVGDKIQWSHQVVGSGASTIKDISQTADDTYIERPLYIPASQQTIT